MEERAVILTYRGERKNLRGRYSEGSCILTPKGWYLWLKGRWMKLEVEPPLDRGLILKKKEV